MIAPMGKVELKLEIDADLLARARAKGLEPASVLEDALGRAVGSGPRPLDLVETAREKARDPEGAERRAREWAERNRTAIEDHNAWVAAHGCFGDAWRSW